MVGNRLLVNGRDILDRAYERVNFVNIYIHSKNLLGLIFLAGNDVSIFDHKRLSILRYIN